MPRLALALSVTVCPLISCKTQDAKRAEPRVELAYQPLGSLPIEGEMPLGVHVDDSTRSAGFPAVTIYTTPTTFIFGSGEVSDVQATFEQAEAREAKQVNGFHSWTRQDRTADGWILEGTGESLIDKQPLYAVSVRRTIAGASYDCSANARSRQEVAAALRICASLRPTETTR
jgi:hypothetical protein